MGRRLKETPARPCERCGKLFYRGKRPSGRWQSVPEFRQQKYCSLICANSTGALTEAGKLARAKKHRKAMCEACGHMAKLHSHHVDGDQGNNLPENIQTLCAHCHGFWHNMLERRGLPIGGRMPRLIPF